MRRQGQIPRLRPGPALTLNHALRRAEGGVKEKGRGQAMVEFALVIAVTLLLAVGAIQSLHAYYLTRQVRAAAEEIADVAATHGGDNDEVRAQAEEILKVHRLDPTLAYLEIVPPSATYLDPLTVTLTYNAVVRFYGLFDLRIPPQSVRRLSEGG